MNKTNQQVGWHTVVIEPPWRWCLNL